MKTIVGTTKRVSYDSVDESVRGVFPNGDKNVDICCVDVACFETPGIVVMVSLRAHSQGAALLRNAWACIICKMERRAPLDKSDVSQKRKNNRESNPTTSSTHFANSIHNCSLTIVRAALAALPHLDAIYVDTRHLRRSQTQIPSNIIRRSTCRTRLRTCFAKPPHLRPCTHTCSCTQIQIVPRKTQIRHAPNPHHTHRRRGRYGLSSFLGRGHDAVHSSLRVLPDVVLLCCLDKLVHLRGREHGTRHRAR